MIKKILIIISIFFVALLVWYFFIKPQDYIATFKINTPTGTVLQTLKTWQASKDGSKFIAQRPFDFFEHQLSFNDSVFNYHWEFEKLQDTITKVQVNITDINNSFRQRVLAPFADTDFEKRSKRTVLNFYDHLVEHLENIKVTYKGVDTIKNTYCAYIPITSTQYEKASKMMKYYPTLDHFALNKHIKTAGSPFIEIVDWNQMNDSISFNFCYPIKKTDSLPEHDLIKYKQYIGKEAIRATYNGNYITSDRAWYVLLEMAKNEGLSIEKKPIEVFLTNPNMGGVELDWIAEIYMPLAE